MPIEFELGMPYVYARHICICSSHMIDGTRPHTWFASLHTCLVTGWRRPIACLMLQVFSRERATNYRAVWREMTDIDKASYDSTPPCTWLRHATHTKESRYTHERVMSHTKESCHTRKSHVTHERVMSHTKESCHTSEWCTRLQQFMVQCHTHEWVMSHTWMSHVTCMNTSWHTCARVVLQCVLCFTCVCHDSHMCNITHTCNITHMWSYMCQWVPYVARVKESQMCVVLHVMWHV